MPLVYQARFYAASFGVCLVKKRGMNIDKTILDLHDFADGIYYVRIIDEQGKAVTKKLVKE